jgi:phage minor structural protein
MENIIRVYGQNMKKLAYLQNAYNIGYELTLNELWTAQFTLPADDPKNLYCQPFNYVEIFDGGERVELFRIMPSDLTRGEQGTITYQCEHVLATLLDDVLFQYHQVGGGSIGTVAVLRYILDRQITNRWQLGYCDFDRRFEYKWENENLLAALFSVPRPFDERYRWEFDTTDSVWRLHLKKLPVKFKADIVYRKNMTEIKKEVDPTSIVTRLYCLGYGEGDNQLGIESVNDGVPYLQANGEATTWGIKSSILVDRRFESPETLKAYGQALLNELKNPFKSYSVQAVDLYRKSPEKYEKFFPGDIVRIIDKEDGITEDLPIIKVSKADITGSPGSVEIEIANKTRDIAGSISTLQERTRINEVYAQGATNQMIVPFADNADPANPAVMRLYIPDTLVRINKCILNYRLEPFRAYSKAVSSVEGTTQTSESSGGEMMTSENSTVDVTSGGRFRGLLGVFEHNPIQPAGGHNHGIGAGRRLATEDEEGVGWVPYQDHTHPMLIPDMVYEIPAHSHRYENPRHSHKVTIPGHGHVMGFGIYQGQTAESVTIKVDGQPIPSPEAGEDIDIISYLSVDSAGKVQRNTWHEVEITPGSMTRIVANIFMQIFTQSRGGGDY